MGATPNQRNCHSGWPKATYINRCLCNLVVSLRPDVFARSKLEKIGKVQTYLLG